MERNKYIEEHLVADTILSDEAIVLEGLTLALEMGAIDQEELDERMAAYHETRYPGGIIKPS